MEYQKLSSEKRADSGKGVARQLRFKGRVPAILYGHKKEPVQLDLSEIDLRKIFQVSTDSVIVNDYRQGSPYRSAENRSG